MTKGAVVTDTRLSDISEHQENFDAPAYLGGGYTCLIVRAHNGHRPDHKWPARRDYCRSYEFTALGWYQYLVESRDAAQQAREFIDTVGPLRGNEFVVLDHEEGSGNQVSRAEAWFSVVDSHYGWPAALYAGESFGNDNLGGWGRWSGRPRWVAAYRSSEPTVPHDLWQNTSSASFPGLAGGVDGNIFHGTASEFIHRMRPGQPTITQEDIVAITAAVAANGNFHVFVEDKDGDIWYTWQAKDKTSWSGGEPGKSVAGLGFFAKAPK